MIHDGRQNVNEVIGLDEKRALKALRRKDEAALAWLIERYCPYVSTIVYNIIGKAMTIADVEEVASDVFFVLWSNADKVKSDKLKAYLGGVARNKARSKLRQTGMDLPLEDDIIISSENTTEQTFFIQEQEEIMNRALLSLQYPDREIFLRHYYYCQTTAQIAEELEMNISTVKTKLRRGRDKLKEILVEGGYENGSEDFRYDGLHSG